MLKVYYVCNYVSIDGAKWRAIGNCGYKVADEECGTTLVLDNASFAEAREFLSQKMLDGVWNESTYFRHKPIIAISYRDASGWVEYRHFDTMSYKREYKEYENVSFKWLTEHLTADQFIQYLKERGITTCPMNF